MSISQASKKIKSKLSFDDYIKPETDAIVAPADQQQLAGMPANHHQQVASKPASRRSQEQSEEIARAKKEMVQKTKITFYADEISKILLNEVYIKYLKSHKKVDKSGLLCKAIFLLHNKEMK